MKKILAGILLALGLPICQTAREDKSAIILPDPKLLTCKAADCSQLWLDKAPNTSGTFPKQLIIDFEQGCAYGLMALYESSVSVDNLKAAIDEKYGKWAVPGFEKSALRLWRVEPEKFAIQLSVADKSDQKKGVAEQGTKRVIFIAFGGRSACTH